MKIRKHKNLEKTKTKNSIISESTNEIVDRYTNNIYKDLQQKGIKDIRTLDILVYLLSDKYINAMVKTPDLELKAREYISTLIENEMKYLLEQKFEENVKLGISENKILQELRKIDCATEVLNVKVPSDEMVIKLQECVNSYIEEKTSIGPFVETVRAYTDNFKFLTTDIPRHSAERGHYKVTKFESLEEFLEFKEIQDILNSNKHEIATELQSINSVLRFNDLTKEQRQVLTKRKQVLLNEEKTR